MTVIVGYKHEGKVYIGGDTAGWSSYRTVVRKDTKVFVSNGIAYGFTSSYRMGQILKYHTYRVLDDSRENDVYGYVVRCLVPMWKDILKSHGYMRTNSGEDEGGTFLVGIDGRLFLVDADFQVAESEDEYDACGSGLEYALGALDTATELGITEPEKVLNLAVGSAIKNSPGCGGNLEYVVV